MSNKKPIFSFVDHLTDLDNVLITSSMSELEFPTSNLADPWVAKRLRSPVFTFNVDSKNDKVDFNVGGAEKTATLAHGAFRPDELAGEVATQMNDAAAVTDITVEYDFENLRFSVTKDAGTLQLLCATGTNKRTSAYSTLGFNCATDKTGALTYTATYQMTSTHGTMVIDSTNNKLYLKHGGTDKTMTIASGTYSVVSLLSELKYQTDTQTSVTNYDFSYDYTTLKYTIKRSSGTFDTRFATFTTAAIAPALGFDATDTAGVTTITADEIRIHTYETILFALTEEKQLDLVALFGFNFSDTATITLQGNDTDVWTSPTFSQVFLWDARVLFLDDGAGNPDLPATAPSFLFYRIKIEDRDNPDGYVELSVPWGGPYFELSRWMRYFGPKGAHPLVDRIDSDQGLRSGSKKGDSLKNYKFELLALSDTDKDNLTSLADACETILPFVSVLNFDGAPSDETFYGYFNERMTFSPRNVVDNAYNTTLFVEDSA